MSKSNEKKRKENEDSTITKPKYITDLKLIREPDKQPLYICPSETEETFDDDLLKNNRLKKSSEKVGYGDPILVAVWLDDPNRESKTSEERVHMRIIEGRHRYLQDKNWPRKYVFVGSIKQFFDYQDFFGIRKKDNREERKAKIIMSGNFLRNQGTPLEEIAAELCRWKKGVYTPQEILDYVPQEWKNKARSANRKNKIIQKKDNDIVQKSTQELENLETENQRLKRELENEKAENQRLKRELENKETIIQNLGKEIEARMKKIMELESRR